MINWIEATPENVAKISLSKDKFNSQHGLSDRLIVRMEFPDFIYHFFAKYHTVIKEWIVEGTNQDSVTHFAYINEPK